MSGFTKFLLRGNVVDLAIAVVIGTAFTAVVNGFVAAVVTPLVGLATGASGDVSRKAVHLGGTRFPYGVLLQATLTFVLTAAVVYFLVLQPVNRLMERFRTEPDVPSPTKTCPDCLSSIPHGARRCAFCTTVQPGAAPAAAGDSQ